MLSGYIGYWEDRLSFSPLPEDEHLFIGRPLSYLVEDRQVVVFPDPDGRLPEATNRDKNGGIGLLYRWPLLGHPWARWVRYELEMTVDKDGSFTFEVPADHKLPWPHPRYSYRTNMDELGILAREFRLRVLSAYLAEADEGIKMFVRDVPSRIKRKMPTSTWAHIINSVRTGDVQSCT